MRTHRHGPYSVQVADDGAIHVARGDILGKYSMAIHGNPWTLWEYARSPAPSQLLPIKDVNVIYAGETLYHLPTLSTYLGAQAAKSKIPEDAVRKVQQAQPPKPPSRPEAKKAILDFLVRTHSVSRHNLDRVDSFLGVVGDLGSVVDLLSTFGALSEGLGSVAGIAGMPLFAISTWIALYKANDYDNKLYEMLAVGYTYTAWAFGDALPGGSRRFLRNSDKKWRTNEYHRRWMTTQLKVLHQITKTVQKLKLRTRDVQAGVRIIVAHGSRQQLMKSLVLALGKEFSKSGKVPDEIRYLSDYRYPQ